jgi:ribosome-associated translation inhibitor RaiA
MNYIIYEFFQVLSTELQVNVNTIYNVWENFNSRYINQIQEENISLKELKFKPSLETIEENEEPILPPPPPPSLNCTPLASPLITKAPPPSPHFITPPQSPSLLKAPPPSRVQSPSPLSQSSQSPLDGVTDDLVGFFYRIAKMLYKIEDKNNRIILKELMSRIEREKPMFEELCNDYNLVCNWYNIMIKHNDDNLSPLFQVVLDELEDMMKKLKPKLYTTYDVSTRKNRGKCEPIYIMKIVYNSNNFIWKLNVKGITND